MTRPVIGITTDLEKGKCILNANYVTMIIEAGGLPVLLPPVPDQRTEQLELVDAVILSGGDDIDPRERGLPLHPKARPMETIRQAAELSLLDALEAQPDVPVLGICLGMQLMGFHAGAGLLQHLPDVLASGAGHAGNHEHEIEGLLGRGIVTSQHHQALADPARFEITARSRDGVIEAIRDPGRPFCVGVQWHPERTRDPSLGLGIIAMVIEAARRRKGLS